MSEQIDLLGMDTMDMDELNTEILCCDESQVPDSVTQKYVNNTESLKGWCRGDLGIEKVVTYFMIRNEGLLANAVVSQMQNLYRVEFVELAFHIRKRTNQEKTDISELGSFFLKYEEFMRSIIKVYIPGYESSIQKICKTIAHFLTPLDVDPIMSTLLASIRDKRVLECVTKPTPKVEVGHDVAVEAIIQGLKLQFPSGNTYKIPDSFRKLTSEWFASGGVEIGDSAIQAGLLPINFQEIVSYVQDPQKNQGSVCLVRLTNEVVVDGGNIPGTVLHVISTETKHIADFVRTTMSTTAIIVVYNDDGIPNKKEQVFLESARSAGVKHMTWLKNGRLDYEEFREKLAEEEAKRPGAIVMAEFQNLGSNALHLGTNVATIGGNVAMNVGSNATNIASNATTVASSMASNIASNVQEIKTDDVINVANTAGNALASGLSKFGHFVAETGENLMKDNRPPPPPGQTASNQSATGSVNLLDDLFGPPSSTVGSNGSAGCIGILNSQQGSTRASIVQDQASADLLPPSYSQQQQVASTGSANQQEFDIGTLLAKGNNGASPNLDMIPGEAATAIASGLNTGSEALFQAGQVIGDTASVLGNWITADMSNKPSKDLITLGAGNASKPRDLLTLGAAPNTSKAPDPLTPGRPKTPDLLTLGLPVQSSTASPSGESTTVVGEAQTAKTDEGAKAEEGPGLDEGSKTDDPSTTNKSSKTTETSISNDLLGFDAQGAFNNTNEVPASKPGEAISTNEKEMVDLLDSLITPEAKTTDQNPTFPSKEETQVQTGETRASAVEAEPKSSAPKPAVLATDTTTGVIRVKTKDGLKDGILEMDLSSLNTPAPPQSSSSKPKGVGNIFSMFGKKIETGLSGLAITSALATPQGHDSKKVSPQGPHAQQQPCPGPYTISKLIPEIDGSSASPSSKDPKKVVSTIDSPVGISKVHILPAGVDVPVNERMQLLAPTLRKFRDEKTVLYSGMILSVEQPPRKFIVVCIESLQQDVGEVASTSPTNSQTTTRVSHGYLIAETDFFVTGNVLPNSVLEKLSPVGVSAVATALTTGVTSVGTTVGAGVTTAAGTVGNFFGDLFGGQQANPGLILGNIGKPPPPPPPVSGTKSLPPTPALSSQQAGPSVSTQVASAPQNEKLSSPTNDKALASSAGATEGGLGMTKTENVEAKLVDMDTKTLETKPRTPDVKPESPKTDVADVKLEISSVMTEVSSVPATGASTTAASVTEVRTETPFNQIVEVNLSEFSENKAEAKQDNVILGGGARVIGVLGSAVTTGVGQLTAGITTGLTQAKHNYDSRYQSVTPAAGAGSTLASSTTTGVGLSLGPSSSKDPGDPSSAGSSKFFAWFQPSHKNDDPGPLFQRAPYRPPVIS